MRELNPINRKYQANLQIKENLEIVSSACKQDARQDSQWI
jgi:hypothetical protein